VSGGGPNHLSLGTSPNTRISGFRGVFVKSRKTLKTHEFRGLGLYPSDPLFRPPSPDGRGRLGAQFLIVYILVSSKPALQNPVILVFGMGVAKPARETANSGQFSATFYGLFPTPHFFMKFVTFRDFSGFLGFTYGFPWIPRKSEFHEI
jgi:hypothetical protein